MNIGITLGDIAGIGPEVVVKALASGKLSRRAKYCIIGDVGVATKTSRKLGVDLKTPVFAADESLDLESVKPGVVSSVASRAAADWIRLGVQLHRRGAIHALVTAPVNKQGLALAGVKHSGQTEWLAELTRTKKFAMMLVGGKLRVALVTTHLPLREVSRSISRKKIVEVIELTHAVLPRFGTTKRRIGVAALNPHAGDGGLLGNEENKIIAPAVADARRKKINAVGPVPADTLFHRAYEGEFDAVVAMYHDQGLAPLKMLAFDTGVNVTLGLPFIRTSPDHGTAYDIAGKGIANPTSMIEAINLAVKLIRSESKLQLASSLDKGLHT
jgi:4-hydroxythreonine-4-phosphate dehydrogenase